MKSKSGSLPTSYPFAVQGDFLSSPINETLRRPTRGRFENSTRNVRETTAASPTLIETILRRNATRLCNDENTSAIAEPIIGVDLLHGVTQSAIQFVHINQRNDYICRSELRGTLFEMNAREYDKNIS